MTKRALLLILCCLTAACGDRGEVRAKVDGSGNLNGVIYGEDSVRDLQDGKIQGSFRFQRNIKASAALVSLFDIYQNPDKTWYLNDKTVQERFRTCDKFTMSQQAAPASCSAVLISSNTILTAAHCLGADPTLTCASTSVVFGFDQKIATGAVKTLQNSQVYRCKKIVEVTDPEKSEIDYALVELDRPVEGVTPIEMPSVIQPMFQGQSIYTVGYPVGTSKKIASGRVRAFSKSLNPVASLDIYFGNSGGPIFDEKTNELVGVVTSGEEDFVETAEGCQLPKRCDDNGCLGEMLTPLSKISGKMNPLFLKALQAPRN